MKYSKAVIVAIAQHALHRAGLFYQRRLEITVEYNSHYDVGLRHVGSHTNAIDDLAADASVVAIGSGPAGVASQLVHRDCKVAVDHMRPHAQTSSSIAVHVQDLIYPIPFELDAHDVLNLDAIEHVRSARAVARPAQQQLPPHTARNDEDPKSHLRGAGA